MNLRHLPSQHEDVLSIPATELAAFDARSLFQLKTLAADRLATAKAEVDHIEHALNLKYAERAKHLRLVAGKDSGVVHFDDGEVRITADLPKKVEWDQALLANIRPATKVVLFETLTNPTLKVVDPRVVVEAARKVGAITVCDNTFLTPYLLRPLELGIDLVMHSGTKYLGGHGDIIAGVVAGSHALMKSVRTVALKHIGSPIGPQEAYLLQRGVKTLPLRMDAHLHNAQKVADFLAAHPAVKKVIYPGLASHPGHDALGAFASGFGGMVSIELEGGFARCATLLDNLQLFVQAVSLGDLESLACHPASTTHAAMDEASRLAAGVNDDLIRFSIGVEDADDLIADLAAALALL